MLGSEVVLFVFKVIEFAIACSRSGKVIVQAGRGLTMKVFLSVAKSLHRLLNDEIAPRDFAEC